MLHTRPQPATHQLLPSLYVRVPTSCAAVLQLSLLEERAAALEAERQPVATCIAAVLAVEVSPGRVATIGVKNLGVLSLRATGAWLSQIAASEFFVV